LGFVYISGAAALGAGTSTFDGPALSDNDAFGPSFLTIGLFVLKFEGFGASWYLHTVASDPKISEVGREVY
jgi:hypothetical protein